MGTESRSDYVRGCRTRGCRGAHAAYERDRARRAEGRVALELLPAGRVREHLVWLASQGTGTRYVAAMAGVSRSGLVAILSGVRRRVSADVGTRILAVAPRSGRWARP